MEYHFAAVDACAGTDVDDMVGGEHGVLVMFDNDDAVADVAQFLEGVDKFPVVALVQSDAGFVEDIKNACEL